MRSYDGTSDYNYKIQTYLRSFLVTTASLSKAANMNAEVFCDFPLSKGLMSAEVKVFFANAFSSSFSETASLLNKPAPVLP